jgi:hypothetical protein
MKAWVIAPSAAEANTAEQYLPDIEKYQVAITGRPITPSDPLADKKQLGKRFASIQVGDLIILANGMNKKKACYFAGFAGEVGSTELAAKIGAAQVRHITDFVSLKGKKIGLPEEYFGDGIDPEVREKVTAAIEVLKDLGAEVEKFSFPIAEYAIPTYYIIACAEACSNLSRYDGIKYGYRPEGDIDLTQLYIKSRSEGFGLEVRRDGQNKTKQKNRYQWMIAILEFGRR